MSRAHIQKRHQARFLLIQALYQWQISETFVSDLLAQFQLAPQFQQADADYFSDSLRTIIAQVKQLDSAYQPYCDRDLSELDPIELSILRLATYELAARPDIPYRVIINEALELAKIFASTDGHKYINGVLDKTAKKLRASEIK